MTNKQPFVTITGQLLHGAVITVISKNSVMTWFKLFVLLSSKQYYQSKTLYCELYHRDVDNLLNLLQKNMIVKIKGTLTSTETMVVQNIYILNDNELPKTVFKQLKINHKKKKKKQDKKRIVHYQRIVF